ncbi:MAG TPA: HAMP domain-containing sensor histidine kinase [Jatrophihabitans sp.]|jgi:two-component system OmpR family sensor kinase|uniref:sensor histidine kinase n=1 Tax=Jatrophihabitans sp. TaxID=1932789 RepID=UPI002E0778BC|nr:HAMP domain-containing sensor histidine kinase [Jatrophihabitans sp.]
MSERRFQTPRLRTQLVALLLALLVVAFVLVALVTSIALRGFLIERLDQQLAAAGDRFSLSLEHPDGDADNNRFSDVAGQATGTLGARVLNGTVTAAAVVGRDPDDRSTAPGSRARAQLATLTASSHPRTIRLEHLGEYRIIVNRGQDQDLLITGLPEHPVDETIGRLVGIEAVVFAGALALAGISGAFFVRLALRPLNRVAETASRVSDLPLSSGTVSLPERAPEGDPHTEVGTLSTAFNHMLEHVESSLHQRQASEERLRRFIADASHELRTPVAVVRSHAELARRTGGPLTPEVERSLTRIGAESERMGHLVDDLLLLARLDTGRPLAHDEVDLTRLVLDATSDARVAGPQHRWQLDLPREPIAVDGDEHALHQVLANLLANARTHTPDGTTVLVSLQRTDTGQARIEVADDGPGVPAPVLPGIFERFVRADQARSASTGSSGLGLAIVDAIVRAHGGTITVTSRPGDTRFTVTLGASRSSEEDLDDDTDTTDADSAEDEEFPR